VPLSRWLSYREMSRGAALSRYSTATKYPAPAGLYLLMSAYGHRFSEAWR